MKAEWRTGEFEKLQVMLVERYPEVVQKIDVLIAEIASMVSRLPPEKILHRSWWELTMRSGDKTSESELNFDDGIALRMIDYIQSVLVSIPRAEAQTAEVTEEDWTSLRDKVAQLFWTLLFDYQVCASANALAPDSEHDANFEEFKFRAQMHWCAVRGTRYQVHQVSHLYDMFIPFTDILSELFGLTAHEFVGEISKIWRSLSYGLGEAVEAARKIGEEVLDAADEKINSSQVPERDPRDIIAEAVEARGLLEPAQSAFGRVFGFDLFNLQKVANLPVSLLDELSWSPGEEKDFFSPGPFAGWPLRIWPTFKRPFVKLNGTYMCFDLYGLFDNIYRVMQRIVMRKKPDFGVSWNRIQQKLSEELPFKYLRKILIGAREFRSVFYPTKGHGSGLDWCEADGLIVYDDHLFIVEVRAGAFTYTPPATDFPAYIASLKNLVLKPATQGKRFLEYLHSAGSVPIFDSEHKAVASLRRSDFRHTTICAVTVDPFTEIAAQVQHLRKIGVDVGIDPVWAMSIDDLRVYADVFDNPLVFLHYVEQRIQAFRSESVQLDDELDHLGLYLKHNHYTTHAEQLSVDSSTRISFAGYRDEVDRYFNAKMREGEQPGPLRQKISRRLFEIVERLSLSTVSGRSVVASYILDLNGDARDGIAKEIANELEQQPATRRAKPLSTSGGVVALTIFCWSPFCEVRDVSIAVTHTRKVLLLHDEPSRLLLELKYSAAGELTDVSWNWITPTSIPPDELPSLRADAERLRVKRISSATAAKKKTGRNEPCPCGSGNKYKKCCIDR